MEPVVRLRLSCQLFNVNVRVREMNGHFLASADTPEGPTLGTGTNAIEAITETFEPFSGVLDELLDSLPRSMN